MDDMTLLKDLPTDAPPLPDDVRRAARIQLLREINGAARPHGSHWVPRLPVIKVAATAGALALVTAAATMAVVAQPEQSDPGSRVARSAAPKAEGKVVTSASRVLLLAAARSRTASAQAVEPRGDQYIYVRQSETVTPNGGGRDAEKYVSESWRSVDGSKPSLHRQRGDEDVVPPLSDLNPGPGFRQWPPANWNELKKLPTDPDELLVTLRQEYAKGDPHFDPSKITHPTPAPASAEFDPAYMYLDGLLRAWKVMPPGLQAAAFEAMAQLPGVELKPGHVKVGDRVGIRVVYPLMSEGKETLILEEGTYDYLGGEFEAATVLGAAEGTDQRTTVLEESGIVDEMGQRP